MVLPVDGPIPGANYTSDTRNYPWHRPPEYTDYDDAVEYLITKINEPESLDLVMSLLELKMDVTSVVTSLLLQSISKGKIPIDLAILIAGPVARYVGIIASEAGIKPKMTVETANKMRITPTSLKMSLGIVDGGKMPPLPPEEPVSEEGGLMAKPQLEDIRAASDEEQSVMLGSNDDEEPDNGLA
jgi:hypothetical protein